MSYFPPLIIVQTDLKHFSGQPCRIIQKITEPDENHDAEVLPMYIVATSNDGFVTETILEVYPDEIDF